MIEPCFVYLFGYEHAQFQHAVKVGISNNVFARLGQIQSHNPNIVIPHFNFEFYTRDFARKVESRFHRRHSHVGIHGEWFGFESSNHALFLLTMEVVRALSESYPSDAQARVRRDSGLLKAFAILDGEMGDDEAERWNMEWMDLEEAPV
jgi:hypothetical protein